MPEWSLHTLLAELHSDIEQRLARVRRSLAHPGTKGDGSEAVWLQLLQTYLPKRYLTEKAHVVDSNGQFSDQLDVVVFDKQYTPIIFELEGQLIIPVEGVYAVFEAKQSLNAEQVRYAQQKVASVRRLYRTSLPIPHAGGMYPAKPPQRILGGLLTLESDWSPPLGKPLISALEAPELERLDLGCAAAHGLFSCDENNCHLTTPMAKAATAFLFELIARLQAMATVSMIDIRAYAAWLNVEIEA